MPAPGEALWLEEDLAGVLAFLEDEGLRCPGCGLPRDETMSPEAEGQFRARALRCHACAAKEREAQKFSDARRRDAGGLFFAVEER